jgi:pimeloyl-ACP methyl ester carboxylesterase
MGTVTTKDGTEIFYKDWGTGEPIFFHHGWPLSADDWDAQMMFFLQKGYRVIAHDRRGHGRSTQTAVGHDMVLTRMMPTRSSRSSISRMPSISATQRAAAKSRVTLPDTARVALKRLS